MNQQLFNLTSYDKNRYNRQMLLEGWGEDGQLKLNKSKVFIAGAGGLGSPVSLYLAAAGVGKISICDDDKVELSNLNRQILHSDSRLGMLKALSAEMTLIEANPTISVNCISEHLVESNAERIIGQPDIVVDCLDNYDTRFLLNTYCVNNNIPFIHAAVSGLFGQITFIHPFETPCLRCIIPETPPKTIFPILGATAGVLGSLQAMETLKYLIGFGELLKGRMLIFDGESMSFELITANRRFDCPVCGEGSNRKTN